MENPEKRTCCVPNCSYPSTHLFTKNKLLQKAWTVSIRKGTNMPNWNPQENSRICKKHFKKTDFLKKPKHFTPRTTNRLKPGTVPTIFAKSETKSKLLTSSRSTAFLKSNTITEIPKTAIPMKVTEKKELAFRKTKSESKASMTKINNIRWDENQDISNWKFRKELLHIEEILGKMEYVFSLQDFNGRELEEKELEQIISTFPPLTPPNQILPLSSSHHNSV